MCTSKQSECLVHSNSGILQKSLGPQIRIPSQSSSTKHNSPLPLVRNCLVGDCVGESVGLSEGDVVGLAVTGEFVGDPVGECVGPVEGDMVGLCVGDPVGLCVGLVEGDVEGLCVGDPVGLCVGLVEGDVEGLCVGDNVGDVVGSGVGNVGGAVCKGVNSNTFNKPSTPTINTSFL
jgi:hypothetical protein